MLKSNNKMDKDKIYDISEMFNYFGSYQIIQYSFICVPMMFVCMVDVNYVFVAGSLDYRCVVPECEDGNSTAAFPQWWPNWVEDRCTKPVLSNDFQQGYCTNTSFTDTVKCTEWIYESNNTVVATLNLACKPWKVSLIGTIHNIGLLSSMVFSGWISDNFGRKPAFLISALGSALGQLKVLMTNWNSYVTIEFLEAFMAGGTYTSAVVLMLEISSVRKRAMATVIFAYFLYSGETLYACIAMFVPYWKTMVHIIYTPFLFYFIHIFFLHESPRWLIVKGKCEEAKKILEIVAKTNKLKINHEEWKNMDLGILNEKFNIKGEVKESLVTVFKSKEILKRLFVSCVCRFVVGFVYYGLMLNSVWLPGDKNLNFLLSTVMSFPGELICLYFMNKFGRKIPLIVSFMVIGILCIVSGYIIFDNVWINISMFMLSKMIIACSFTGVVTYTTELFPTNARGSLLSLCFFSSRLGSMLAPLTPILNTISVSPSIIFGVSSVVGAAVLFLTPETKDLPLMDTVNQIEDSVKKPTDFHPKGTENLKCYVTAL